MLAAGVSATFGKGPADSPSAKCSLQCAPLSVIEKKAKGKENTLHHSMGGYLALKSSTPSNVLEIRTSNSVDRVNSCSS